MKRATVKVVFNEEGSNKDKEEETTVYVKDPENEEEVKFEIQVIFRNYNNILKPHERKRILKNFKVLKSETF